MGVSSLREAPLRHGWISLEVLARAHPRRGAGVDVEAHRFGIRLAFHLHRPRPPRLWAVGPSALGTRACVSRGPVRSPGQTALVAQWCARLVLSEKMSNGLGWFLSHLEPSFDVVPPRNLKCDRKGVLLGLTLDAASRHHTQQLRH